MIELNGQNSFLNISSSIIIRWWTRFCFKGSIDFLHIMRYQNIYRILLRKMVSKNWHFSFTNHKLRWQVFWVFFDHVPPWPRSVNIFYLINIDKKSTFLDYLPLPLFLFNVVWERPSTRFSARYFRLPIAIPSSIVKSCVSPYKLLRSKCKHCKLYLFSRQKTRQIASCQIKIPSTSNKGKSGNIWLHKKSYKSITLILFSRD